MRFRTFAIGAALLTGAAAVTGVLNSRGDVGGRRAQLGQKAAPLEILEWIQGGPVDIEQGRGEKAYLVEFWATWCGPCRKSAPRLASLQERYADQGLVVVGVSDEDVGTVRRFLETDGKEMTYTVAIDNGKTRRGYMDAYRRDGLPWAFLVDRRGLVVWEGSPLEDLNPVIKQVLAR